MKYSDDWIDEAILKPAQWKHKDYTEAKQTIRQKMKDAKLEEHKLFAELHSTLSNVEFENAMYVRVNQLKGDK